jgi:hypothetical protein
MGQGLRPTHLLCLETCILKSTVRQIAVCPIFISDNLLSSVYSTAPSVTEAFHKQSAASSMFKGFCPTLHNRLKLNKKLIALK